MHATARRQPATRRSLLGALALLGTAAVTGCTIGAGEPGEEKSGEEKSGEDQADGSAGGDAEEKGSATGSDDSGDETVVDEEAPMDLSELPAAIATAEVPATVDGDPDATLTVALHELRRDGERLVAQFSFRVESTKPDEAAWIYDYLGAQSWNPYLIDPVNLNKHTVPRNSTVEAQTNSQGAKFRPGQTLHAYAMFVVPPEDVTAMDVMLVEGAPLAVGVEIR